MILRPVAALLAAAAIAAGLSASPAAAAPSVPATLVVAPAGGGVIGGGPLDVDVRVTSTGAAGLRAGELAFSIDREPVAAASTLLDSIRHPSEDLQGQLVPVTRRTPALASGASTTVHARLRARDLAGLISPASGARRLYVRLRAPGVVKIIAEAATVRMADNAGRVELGMVVPVVAPPNATGIVDTDAQAALTGPGGAWSGALRAARETPAATVALDPEVLASIRLAGDSAPGSATDFLDGLTALPNEVVGLPYADGDVTLERAAGLPATLEPVTFAGASTHPPAPVATDPPTPAPSPAATDPAVDPIADASSGRIAWPVPGTATLQDVRRLRTGATVLLGSGDVKDTPARAAEGPAATVRGVPVLVSDAQASTLLTRAAAGGPGGDAALATLVGLLATDAVGGVAPRLLATVDRGADVGALDHVFALLARQPWIRGRSTADLAADPTPVEVELLPGATSAAHVATARALLDAESAVRDLGRAIDDPDAIVGPPRLALTALLSAGWRGDDAGWTAAATAAAGGFRRLSRQVRITPASSTTLSGSDGSLPVDVVNDLPRRITVEVVATASNARVRFTGRHAARITVPAGTTKPAELSLQTISNGPTEVTLTLRTPAGATLGSPVMRSVAVRAGLDTVVAVVLLTLLGLLLALGVHRNVRQRSRMRVVAA